MKTTTQGIEFLESRIAPAGVFVDASTLSVSLSGGALKITPLTANASTEVTIEQLPNGDFLISDPAGDADLEEVANFTGAVSSVNVITGTGDDVVHLALHGETGFRGAVSIATGLGSDSVDFLEGLIRGPLTITAKGSADIALGGSGAGVIAKSVVKVAQAGGDFAFGSDATAGSISAAGASSFEIEGTVIGAVSLKSATPATFDIGTSETSPAASIGGVLSISGSTGADVVSIAHVLVRGATSIGLGAGDNELSIASGASFHGAVKIGALGGDDTVVFGTASDAGPQFHGRVSVALGAAVAGNVFTAHSGTFSAGLAYKGGANADTVSIGAGTNIFADLNISGGAGTNTVSVDTFSSLSVFAYNGGVGVDSLTLGGLGHGYTKATAKLGDGVDALVVAPSAVSFFDTFLVDGGLGADTTSVPVAVLADGIKLVNI